MYKNFNNSKLLITGGAGFIGSNLVNFLLENFNSNLVIIDNISNGDIKRIPKNDRITFIKCSVSDIEKYSEHILNSDYIFHMACVQISKSDSIPLEDLDANATSVLKILDVINKNKNNKLKMFLYTSSCSVYGNAKTFPITEESDLDISSFYAASKLLGENYTNLFHKKYGIPTSIIRFSNVYGYNQTPEDKICGVIGKYIYNSINGQPLVVFGDGKQKRDFTFIDDVIDGILLISSNNKSIGKTYNLSTNSSYSVIDLINILKNEYFDLDIKYENPRSIDNISERTISYDMVKNELGWNPKHDLESGIKKTIDWFKIKNLEYEKL